MAAAAAADTATDPIEVEEDDDAAAVAAATMASMGGAGDELSLDDIEQAAVAGGGPVPVVAAHACDEGGEGAAAAEAAPFVDAQPMGAAAGGSKGPTNPTNGAKLADAKKKRKEKETSGKGKSLPKAKAFMRTSPPSTPGAPCSYGQPLLLPPSAAAARLQVLLLAARGHPSTWHFSIFQRTHQRRQYRRLAILAGAGAAEGGTARSKSHGRVQLWRTPIFGPATSGSSACFMGHATAVAIDPCVSTSTLLDGRGSAFCARASLRRHGRKLLC
jgi:hypothetical protein